jgi:hypothetical protein
MRKIQNHKPQVPKKLQNPNSKKREYAGLLEFGAWDLFGIWDLEVGSWKFAPCQ